LAGNGGGASRFRNGLHYRWAFGKDAGVAFVTFLPAVLIAGLAGGVVTGAVVAILSILSAGYFFLPPYGSFAIERTTDWIAIGLFAATSGVQLWVIVILNRTTDRLAVEHERAQTLFRELQHRVANNMQLTVSMLHLQRRALPDDSPGAVALAAAEARLHVMARIHRRLYEPEVLDTPTGEILKGLCTDILDASGVENVLLRVDADPVVLDLKQLVPLALLVAELVTNSLKHAFRGRPEGLIAIRLNRADEILELVVSDDGCGLPENPRPVKEKGLGRKIIKSLVAQLGGELRYETYNGTTVRVRFPAKTF
jgi:two-component system, sensor histidine kinase PdtaS